MATKDFIHHHISRTTPLFALMLYDSCRKSYKDDIMTYAMADNSARNVCSDPWSCLHRPPGALRVLKWSRLGGHDVLTGNTAIWTCPVDGLLAGAFFKHTPYGICRNLNFSKIPIPVSCTCEYTYAYGSFITGFAFVAQYELRRVIV